MQLNSDVVCLILHAASASACTQAAAADATVARTDILYDTSLFRCANFLVQSTVVLSFVFDNYCPAMD